MKRYVLLCSGCLLLLTLFYFARNTPLALILDSGYIERVVSEYGLFAPLVYMGIYILACVMFLPGTPLTLAAGLVFGSVYGTIYTIIGATMGAVCAFYFSRFFGGSLLRDTRGSVSKKLLAYDDAISRNGFMTVLFLRFVPLFPFNGLNFALGFTSVRSRDYILGTFLGIIPGTFVFVLFGDSLNSQSPLHIVGAVFGIVVLSLVGRHLLRNHGKK